MKRRPIGKACERDVVEISPGDNATPEQDTTSQNHGGFIHFPGKSSFIPVTRQLNPEDVKKIGPSIFRKPAKLPVREYPPTKDLEDQKRENTE
jgi:hypothetical protein